MAPEAIPCDPGSFAEGLVWVPPAVLGYAGGTQVQNHYFEAGKGIYHHMSQRLDQLACFQPSGTCFQPSGTVFLRDRPYTRAEIIS